jgi:hypothetical protein
MSLLLGAEYSSGSSSSDDETVVAKAQGPIKPKCIALPSVDDIFVQTEKPKFLKKPTRDETSVVVFDIEEKKDKASTTFTTATRSEEIPLLVPEMLVNDRIADRNNVLNKNDMPAHMNAIYKYEEHDERNVQRQGQTKSNNPPKRKAMDAKERVKAQRLKGQAGIGSDFKTWKSETEMKLRQQFD